LDGDGTGRRKPVRARVDARARPHLLGRAARRPWPPDIGIPTVRPAPAVGRRRAAGSDILEHPRRRRPDRRRPSPDQRAELHRARRRGPAVRDRVPASRRTAPARAGGAVQAWRKRGYPPHEARVMTVTAEMPGARSVASQGDWIARTRRCSVRPLMTARVEERTSADEFALLTRLRAGDERAFEDIVERYYASMLAVARGYVRSQAVAEEVVQDAWLGVLKGLERFEGRSRLRTWVLQIVANIARDRAVREARSLPFASLEDAPGPRAVPSACRESGAGEPAVEPERFRGPDEPYPGGWRSFPTDWATLPEER